MSWRVVAAVLIAVFAVLIISMTTAGPLRTVSETINDVDPGGGEFDTQEQSDQGIRGYQNMIYIVVFGLLAWGAWRVVRRELTRGGL